MRAGLRNLDGQYVTTVRRKAELVHAVGPEFMLAAGDVLYLSGMTQFGLCSSSSPPQHSAVGKPAAD